MDEFLSANYWDNRYRDQNTGWDVGYATPAITAYIDQLTNKDISILIPGCGNAYEAEYLAAKGFVNITCIDISPALCNALTERWRGQPMQVVCGDFFAHQGQYDLILEQTFFCALNPSLRDDYAKQMAHLLKPGGKLVGLLFDCERERIAFERASE